MQTVNSDGYSLRPHSGRGRTILNLYGTHFFSPKKSYKSLCTSSKWGFKPVFSFHILHYLLFTSHISWIDSVKRISRYKKLLLASFLPFDIMLLSYILNNLPVISEETIQMGRAYIFIMKLIPRPRTGPFLASMVIATNVLNMSLYSRFCDQAINAYECLPRSVSVLCF